MAKKKPPRAVRAARRRAAGGGASVMRMNIVPINAITKAAFEAHKSAGRPYFDVNAGNVRDDKSFAIGGMMFDRGLSVPVTGTLPDEVRDLAEAPAPSKHAPKKIARWLSTRYFVAMGCTKKKARISAAAKVDPVMQAEDAERLYRREAQNILDRELRGYNRTILLSAKQIGRDDASGIYVFMAHKTAIIETLPDGFRLIGNFWCVKIGDHVAARVGQDYFYARDGAGIISGGQFFPV